MIYDDHSMIMSCMSQVTGAVCTWEPAFRCLSYGECTLQLWHPCATARAAVLNGHTNLISKAEALRVWNMLGCWMVLTHGWPESSWFGILFGTKFEPFGRSLQVSWDRELALSWADDSTLKLWDLKAGGSLVGNMWQMCLASTKKCDNAGENVANMLQKNWFTGAVGNICNFFLWNMVQD